MRCRIMFAVVTIPGWFAIGATPIATQSPFSYGLFQNSCAPWDGPAIDIRLMREPSQCKRLSGPYINIGIWRGLPIHAGQTVKFGPTSSTGFASRCSKVGDCEHAESGTIVFERYQDGSGASGCYELHFKGNEDLNGTFYVKWCEHHLLCG
jgi:hypothetical protein